MSGFLPLAFEGPPSPQGSGAWFWSTLGILYPHYPPYQVSLLLSTWGGARWETTIAGVLAFISVLTSENKTAPHIPSALFSDT
jgi:hypothetical protein